MTTSYMAKPNSNPKRYLVCKIIGTLFIVLLIVLGLTNPKKETHEDKIRTEISKAIDSSTKGIGDNIISKGLIVITHMMAGSFVDSALDFLFEYHNYILFSKGTITIEGKSHTVSYGVLGNVYTIDSKELLKQLEKTK